MSWCRDFTALICMKLFHLPFISCHTKQGLFMYSEYHCWLGSVNGQVVLTNFTNLTIRIESLIFLPC